MARGFRLSGWALLAGAAGLAAALLFPFPLAPAVASPLATLVHLSERHLIANLIGCAVLGWLGQRAAMDGPRTLAWLLAWPLGQIALLAGPPLTHFGGLSGWLHAGCAIVAVTLLQRHGRERLIGAALLVGLITKLAFEQPLSPPHFDPAWGFAPAPFAHLAGSVTGALLALLARYWPLSFRRRQKP